MANEDYPEAPKSFNLKFWADEYSKTTEIFCDIIKAKLNIK